MFLVLLSVSTYICKKGFKFYIYSVCIFKSMKSPVELNNLLELNVTWFDERGKTGGLVNEDYKSKSIVLSKQWLSGLKTATSNTL